MSLPYPQNQLTQNFDFRYPDPGISPFFSHHRVHHIWTTLWRIFRPNRFSFSGQIAPTTLLLPLTTQSQTRRVWLSLSGFLACWLFRFAPPHVSNSIHVLTMLLLHSERQPAYTCAVPDGVPHQTKMHTVSSPCARCATLRRLPHGSASRFLSRLRLR